MKLAFVTIDTLKMEESLTFYVNALSYELLKREKTSETVEIAFLKDPSGTVIELIQREGAPAPSPLGVSLTFYVDDLDATHQHLMTHGLPNLDGPKTLPGGLEILLAEDPNGVALGFIKNQR